MIHAGQSVVQNPTAKKGFLIPVTWEVCDFVRVQANTLEEAYEWMQEHADEVPLGTDPEYIDGSYRVGDMDECECYLGEVVEYDTTLTKRAVNIEWDFDGEEDPPNLPNEVNIPTNVFDEDVADWLSDNFGWCVKSYSLEETET